MVISKIIFLILFIIFAPHSIAVGERKNVNYSVVMQSNLESGIPKENFSCEDKIFLYFTWFGLQGSHYLSSFWYNPRGRVQETTEYNFSVKNERESNTWLWLKLRKGKGKGFDFIDRVSLDFTGEWLVEIFLDGDFLERKKFTVIC